MSTNRQWCWAIFGLLVGITGQCAVGDDTAAKADTATLILEKPMAVDPKANEQKRLLIERRNAAIEYLQVTHALYAAGKGTLDPVVMAAERALLAQVEVPGSNKYQILEQHVTFARELNKMVDERFDHGIADAASHRLAKCLRLDMELRLAREKVGAKKNAA